MTNEDLLSRITVDPDVCHGKPCVRGLRYPVETLLEYLAGGDTVETLLAEFPDLEREDILACHEFSPRAGSAQTPAKTKAQPSSDVLACGMMDFHTPASGSALAMKMANR